MRWPCSVRRGPSSAAVALLNSLLFVGWVASRTAGLPLVASLAEPETVGVQDLMAALLEAGSGGGGGSRPPPRRPGPPRPPHAAVDPGPQPDHGRDDRRPRPRRGDGDHAHGVAAGAHGVHVGLAADPLFAGADTATATRGGAAGGGESRPADPGGGAEPVPDQEAVVSPPVTRRSGTGSRCRRSSASSTPPTSTTGAGSTRSESSRSWWRALPPGSGWCRPCTSSSRATRCDDVPGQTGSLTTWHEHDNICWDGSGIRIAGFVRRRWPMPPGGHVPGHPADAARLDAGQRVRPLRRDRRPRGDDLAAHTHWSARGSGRGGPPFRAHRLEVAAGAPPSGGRVPAAGGQGVERAGHPRPYPFHVVSSQSQLSTTGGPSVRSQQ